MPQPLVEMNGISKDFPGVHALADSHFDLYPGEVHALVGENGAGKSTLVKIITGAHHPDSGLIRLGGRVMARLTPAISRGLGVACIYQQPYLFPDLTVAENIALRLESPRTLRLVRWKDRQARA